MIRTSSTQHLAERDEYSRSREPTLAGGQAVSAPPSWSRKEECRTRISRHAMEARSASFDVVLARLRKDPHELASWVNQIDGYNARFLLLKDPHELASWVNQIDGYNARFLLLKDPHELASWVNQIES